MADAYGVIIASKSVDFEGDIQGLCKTLNRIGGQVFGWCSSCGEFVAKDGAIHFIPTGFLDVQYPTLFPQRPVGYALWEEGKKTQFVPIEDIGDDDEEIECEWDLELEDIPLSEICEVASIYFDSGFLKLTASANEKARYAYFEEMVIYADGSGRRSRQLNSYYCEDETSSESYEATQASAAA